MAVEVEAVADDLSPKSRTTTRPRFRGYIIAVVVVSLLLTVAVGIGNYALNPLSYKAIEGAFVFCKFWIADRGSPTTTPISIGGRCAANRSGK